MSGHIGVGFGLHSLALIRREGGALDWVIIRPCGKALPTGQAGAIEKSPETFWRYVREINLNEFLNANVFEKRFVIVAKETNVTFRAKEARMFDERGGVGD